MNISTESDQITPRGLRKVLNKYSYQLYSRNSMNHNLLQGLRGYLSQPNVLHMESNFTGVVAPDVTENENIGREIRADDIKTMSLSGKMEETLPVNSIEMN